jgi:hypothetical protein
MHVGGDDEMATGGNCAVDAVKVRLSDRPDPPLAAAEYAMMEDDGDHGKSE